MCYHCATNPSILHCCCHVAAVSSLLSHHGVTFTVTLSQFRHCHCDVAFIVALLRCRCCSCVVVVPSLSHCCGVVITVSSSPLWCHLCRHIVAVSSSQSRRCGAFAVASLWFHCR